MPTWTTAAELSRQCCAAAHSSRLNPFALRKDEYSLLKTHGALPRVKCYLSIRNAILRLWARNPSLCIEKEEALNSVKDLRNRDLANIAYTWLIGNGYINFGCAQSIKISLGSRTTPQTRRILIIGAGVSGLACARQLRTYFNKHLMQRTELFHESVPCITILEGRKRIGGRVYSHPLYTQNGNVKTKSPQHASTAEVGAQIVTGFEHGNPLNAVLRGQLALPYHSLKDELIFYDFDGSVITEEHDTKIQKLFNRILETASIYGWQALNDSMEGHRVMESLRPDHLLEGQGGNSISDVLLSRFSASLPIERTSPNPTLGSMMDDIVGRYQIDPGLSLQDLRLINWHYANLEYGNAVNVSQLSLGGWDQDGGNEFEGCHAQVVGGYAQLPRALLKNPCALDVRLGKNIKRITYNPDDSPYLRRSQVLCDDGEVFEADRIVSSLPLGVMKHGDIDFEPKLPPWKIDAIERLGFGTLNKIILVFRDIFWDRKRDMFGLLNEARDAASHNQKDYARNRGKFYLFWNCAKASGQPVLVALMAGDAAKSAEETPDKVLIKEVTGLLAKVFKLKEPPRPLETIITRWNRDPFTRGTYSYLGPAARPGDYDAVAKATGNLYFAGEATCGSHPATVHGAFLSGLRVASEILDDMLGSVPERCSAF